MHLHERINPIQYLWKNARPTLSIAPLYLLRYERSSSFIVSPQHATLISETFWKNPISFIWPNCVPMKTFNWNFWFFVPNHYYCYCYWSVAEINFTSAQLEAKQQWARALSGGYGRRLMCGRLWVRIPSRYTGWTFFTLICCKICSDVCLKRPKINNNRGRGWPILAKQQWAIGAQIVGTARLPFYTSTNRVWIPLKFKVKLL